MEDCGAIYREDDLPKDVYKIYADNGCNLVRFRLWHTPDFQDSIIQPNGVKSRYHDYKDVAKAIMRTKNEGMSVLLDIHYSDIWADPGRQAIPTAWKDVANDEFLLADSIYQYTYNTLRKLADSGLLPEMVQVGNEINDGFLKHESVNKDFSGGNVLSTSWTRHINLLNSGIRAIRKIEEETGENIQVVIHYAGFAWSFEFYTQLFEQGIEPFDIMGLSYYYAWHKGSINELGNAVARLKNTYRSYDVMVVETGYPWDLENIDGLHNIISETDPSYSPASPLAQLRYLQDLSLIVKEKGGIGVVFWESAWVSTPCNTPWGQGSSLEHVALFDHRNNLNFMKNGGGGWMKW